MEDETMIHDSELEDVTAMDEEEMGEGTDEEVDAEDENDEEDPEEM